MIGLEAQRTNRRAARIAIDVEHPGKRGQHRVVGIEVAVGASLPEGSDGEENQGGVDDTEVVPSQLHLSHPARRKTLDDDVGGFREAAEDFRALGTAYIERQGALVEVIEPEEKASVAMRLVIDEREI